MPVKRHHEPGNYSRVRCCQLQGPMYLYSAISSKERHATAHCCTRHRNRLVARPWISHDVAKLAGRILYIWDNLIVLHRLQIVNGERQHSDITLIIMQTKDTKHLLTYLLYHFESVQCTLVEWRTSAMHCISTVITMKSHHCHNQFNTERYHVCFKIIEYDTRL
jgi:hypothetical protein